MTEQQGPEKSPFSQAHTMAHAIYNEIRKAVIGQDKVVEQVLVALIAGGHVLVEGVPGLGKTLLVRSLAQCFGGDFARIQFTPDLMPTDITGHAMFNMKTQEFDVRKGPVFTNLLLADEINRAPAKTQAALLEVMQEKQITIEGQPYQVEAPFMVLATQNPIEQEGTYPLPEAELDRFMVNVLMDYPEEEDEQAMLRLISSGDNTSGYMLNELHAFLQPSHILSLQKVARKITVDETVLQYAVSLVRATRQWPGVARGAGPRACIALISAARAYALLQDQSFVSPDNVKAMLLPTLRHRILLSTELEIEGIHVDHVLTEIGETVKAPRL